VDLRKAKQGCGKVDANPIKAKKQMSRNLFTNWEFFLLAKLALRQESGLSKISWYGSKTSRISAAVDRDKAQPDAPTTTHAPSTPHR
jgi:hypothetical protein